jgi:hypothetical protein
MTVPSPKTWVAAEYVDAPEANAEWRDVFNFLLAPPRVRVYQSTSQNVTSSGNAVITWDVEEYKSITSMHNNVSSSGKLIAPEDGLYSIAANLRWSGNINGNRSCEVRVNANSVPTAGIRIVIANQQAVTSGGGTVVTIVGVTTEYQLSAGDHIQVFADQDSGSTLSVTSGAGNSFFLMRWIAKLA